MESVSSARLAGGHMHQRPVRTLLGRASPESGGWTRLLWVFLWQCLSWLLWGVRMKQSASILPQKFFAIRSPGITAEREETGSWHCKFSTLLRELTEERSTERTASAIFRKWIKASNFHTVCCTIMIFCCHLVTESKPPGMLLIKRCCANLWNLCLFFPFHWDKTKALSFRKYNLAYYDFFQLQMHVFDPLIEFAPQIFLDVTHKQKESGYD